jgi:hypothetical protein
MATKIDWSNWHQNDCGGRQDDAEDGSDDLDDVALHLLVGVDRLGRLRGGRAVLFILDLESIQ